MAYNLWQRLHLLVWLVSNDYHNRLLDDHTLALGDARVRELLDKFAELKDEHDKPLPFSKLLRDLLLNEDDRKLIGIRKKKNTAHYQSYDLDKYKDVGPDGKLYRKERQLSDATITRDNVRRAIGRVQHESAEAKDKALQ